MSVTMGLAEFQALPESQKQALFFLRGIREKLLEDLKVDCRQSDAVLLEDVANVNECCQSSYRNLRRHLFEDGQTDYLPKLELFRTVCLRIGRFERERCGQWVPPLLREEVVA